MIDDETKKIDPEGEKARIYEQPDDDPAYQSVANEITKQTNLDTEAALRGDWGAQAQEEARNNYGNYWHRQNIRLNMQKWADFARGFPTKAAAYSAHNSWISKSLPRENPDAPAPVFADQPEPTAPAGETDTADEQAPFEDKQDEQVVVPDRYNGLPSNMVEEVWPANTRQTPEEQQRRAKILEKLKGDESAREEEKATAFAERYKSLPPESRTQFVDLQSDSQALLVKHIQEGQDLGIDLDVDEQYVLAKLKTAYEDAKEGRSGQTTEFQLTSPEDQKTWANLHHKITFNLLAEKTVTDDEARADEVREEIGIPTVETASTDGPTPEAKTLTQEEILQIKNEAGFGAKTRDLDPDDQANFDLMNPDNAIDWQIGEQFDAHGIAKDSVPRQFDQLIFLLDNGIDSSRNFHTAPLEKSPDKAGMGAGIGTAGGTAYKDGCFILLGDPGKQISESGIKNVLVNDTYYDAIDRLSQAYPDINFIRADQANQELKKIVEQSKNSQ